MFSLTGGITGTNFPSMENQPKPRTEPLKVGVKKISPNDLRLEKYSFSQHSHLIEDLTKLLHAAYGALAGRGMRYWASYQTPEETVHRLSQGESYLGFCGENLATTINIRGPKPENRTPWYRKEGIYSFHQFAVAPEFQGRGFGSRMMDWIEERAAELGAQELALDTSEKADNLIAMYTKRGYRFVEHVQWDRVNYRSVIMSKKLNSDQQGTASRPF